MVIRNVVRVRRWALLGLTLLVSSSCIERADDTATAERIPRERTFADIAWDTVFVLGGKVQDTTLLLPRLITSGVDRLYVYDYGDSQLKAFDGRGRALWHLGKPGEGPGEFRNAFDLAVAHDGDVWVLDAGAGRIAIVDSAGSWVRTIPLQGQLVRDVIPLQTDLLATPVSAEDRLWVSLSDQGRVIAHGPYEIENLRDAYFGTRFTFAAVADDGERWAAMFPHGDTFLVFDGRQSVCHGKLLNAEPLPALPPERNSMPTAWSLDILFDGERVAILRRGEGADRHRVLDVFRATDCVYDTSLRLPRSANAVARVGDVYVLAYENPAPTLLGVKPVPTVN